MNKATENISNKASIISEPFYERLFDTANDGIILLDFDSGIILDINQFLIELLGYSKEVFLKKHLWDVGVFKNVALAKTNFKILQKRKRVRFENLPIETKKGKKIDVEFIASTCQIGNTSVILCNIRDISVRKKIEKKAQKNEELTQAIIETIIDPILLLDGSLNVHYANDSFYRFFKSSKDETIGKHVYSLGNG